VETGSHMTAHTTIQSHRTAEIVVDRKYAVSAGIFAGGIPSSGLQTRPPAFWPTSGRPSLQRKIPFPAAEADRGRP